jgi:hypothetical protein
MVVEASVTAADVIDAIGTRATQASVDAIQASLGTVATAKNVADLGSSIGQAIGHLTFDRSGLATSADVNAGTAALLDEIRSRAAQAALDALASDLDDARKLSTQAAIERALADGVKLPGIFLPEASGGHLETASTIVSELIRFAGQSGADVNRAQNLFLKGEALRQSAQGVPFNNYKNAFDHYAAAFQLLTK